MFEFCCLYIICRVIDICIFHQIKKLKYHRDLRIPIKNARLQGLYFVRILPKIVFTGLTIIVVVI